MARRYKAAIIGAGNIAALFDVPQSTGVLTHAHAYWLHPGFELCGFVDTEKEKSEAATKRWGGRPYTSIANLVKLEQPEVVSVCTPDETHASMVRELEAKNILGGILEKPLAVDLTGARAIAASPMIKKGKFIVNYSRLFVPEFQELKRAYHDGMYGRLLSATGYYGKGLLHNGSHMISLLSWLFGKIRVLKKISIINDFSTADPSISTVLQLSGTIPCSIHAINSRSYSIFELDMLFSKTRIRMIESGNKIEIYKCETSKRYKGYSIMSLQETVTTSLGRSLSFAVENLYRWLEGSQPPLSTVQEAFSVQKICQGILLSK